MDNNVFVTGAAGFIGSNLCKRLIDDGYRVVAIDSFTDYYSPERKHGNLRDIISHKNFKLIEEDINNYDIREIINGSKCVFHLAAQAGVRMSWGKEFSVYVDSNILTTQKILEALKGNKRTKLVYSSSSSVYGQTDRLPMREDQRLKPVSPYGVTKLSGEHLCELYRINFGINTISLRYFTVYGPRQRPDMAFSRFIVAALTGGEIEIYGDGKQTRDFTFVSDAVEANMLAMEYDGEETIFNIGGGSRVSVLDVLEILKKRIDEDLDISFIDKAKGDVLDTWADTSSVRKELRFSPRIGLEEGIEREIGWYRDFLNSK
jgi:UDP-glucose 4-epimerase